METKSESADCPVSGLGAQFDPFESAYLVNPFPFLERARSEEPIFFNSDINYWIVTRFEDIKGIFKNHKVFTAENTITPVVPFPDHILKMLTDGDYTPEPVLSNNVPPSHTRIRSKVNTLFTPKRMADFEPDICKIVNDQIDKFVGNGCGDIVKELTYDLPALVLFHILGVPECDVSQVKEWAGNRIKLYYGKPTAEEQIEMTKNLVPFWKYTQELVSRKLADPQDDLTSDLIRIRDGDDNILSINEICSLMITLLVAGHETTTAQMTNGIYYLLSERTKWDELRNNFKLIPNAVEEILRFDPAVCAWRRVAREAVTIGGIDIPKDANLLLMLNSANRDAAIFEDPDQFELRRESANQHIAFGYGIHFCVGAQLARLELRILFEELTRRMPELRLVPDQAFQFVPNISFRGPISLQLEWD
jgi:hypothetical protein